MDEKLLKKCVEDIKMLNGFEPYNTPSNIVYADVYFAKSIKDKYSKEMIQEAWNVINKLD